jgi:hypothetical protein
LSSRKPGKISPHAVCLKSQEGHLTVLAEYKVNLKGQPMKRSKPNPKRRKAVTEFLESANIVDCPRYVQRTMRRNPREAAACDVNVRRKKRAQELLAATQAESKSASSKNDGKSMVTKAVAGAMPPAQSTIEPAVPKAPQPAGNRFKQYVQRGLDFVKGRLPFTGSNNHRGE